MAKTQNLIIEMKSFFVNSIRSKISMDVVIGRSSLQSILTLHSECTIRRFTVPVVIQNL